MEFSHLGWNLLTLTFVLTFCCTLAEAFGLAQQRKQIRESRSGEAVSAPLFFYLACLYVVTAFYGWSIHSAALMIDGTVLLLSTVPVLIALAKYKGFTTHDKTIGTACMIAPIVIALTPREHADVVYISFCLFNTLPVLGQAYEMRQAKTNGSVSIVLLWTCFGTVATWSVYGFVFDDLALKIVFPTILASIVATLVTWYRYRRPDATTAT